MALLQACLDGQKVSIAQLHRGMEPAVAAHVPSGACGFSRSVFIIGRSSIFASLNSMPGGTIWHQQTFHVRAKTQQDVSASCAVVVPPMPPSKRLCKYKVSHEISFPGGWPELKTSQTGNCEFWSFQRRVAGCKTGGIPVLKEAFLKLPEMPRIVKGFAAAIVTGLVPPRGGLWLMLRESVGKELFRSAICPFGTEPPRFSLRLKDSVSVD